MNMYVCLSFCVCIFAQIYGIVSVPKLNAKTNFWEDSIYTEEYFVRIQSFQMSSLPQ